MVMLQDTRQLITVYVVDMKHHILSMKTNIEYTTSSLPVTFDVITPLMVPVLLCHVTCGTGLPVN